MKTTENSSIQLNFIIGIGRSGTTILTKLLNEYKNIHCLPEANFLTFFLRYYQHKKKFSDSEIDALFEQINLYFLSNPWVGWEFDANKVKREILDKNAKGLSYQELCSLIYRGFEMQGLNKTNAGILIDKNPSFTLFATEISSAYPNAKFIWVIRDYRANSFSWLQNPYLKESSVPLNATRWLLYNKQAFSFYKKNRDKTLIIKYEDLILNTEAEIKKTLQFLNTDSVFEDDYSEKAKVDLSKFEVNQQYQKNFTKKYSDLNQPVNTNRIDVWAKELTEGQIRLCDAICSSFGKQFGYEPAYSSPIFSGFILKIRCAVSIIKGYMDIYKDKLIYYAPINLKLHRLKVSYRKLGLLKK